MAAAAALRPPMTGLSPLLPRMSADGGLGAAEASALTTLPLLCFAAGALVAPWVIRRWGIDRTVVGVLVALAAFLAVRPWGGFWWLLAGTVGAALVVAVGNVVMPVLIRARHHSGLLTVTGLYSVALALSSSLAAGTAVPLADWLGGLLTGVGGDAGWRASLAFWAVPTLLGAAVWLGFGRERGAGGGRGAHVDPADTSGRAAAVDPADAADAAGGAGPADASGRAAAVDPADAAGGAGPVDPARDGLGSDGPRPARPGGVTRHLTAWLVSLFFGIQGLGFYAFVTWYPTVLVRRGMADALAGGQLSLSLGCGAIAALVVPQLARRLGVGRFIVVTAALIGIGALGVLLGPTGWVAVFSVCIGVGQGGTLPLSLSLVSSRSADTAAATGVSALLNVVGYLLAALGPVLGSVVFRLSGTWDSVLVLLVVMTVVQGVLGIVAHRAPPVEVGPPGARERD